MSLENAVVVITGGGGGFGRSLGLEAVRRGARVVIAAQDDPADVLALLRDAGGTALWKQTDVTDYSSLAALADFLREAFGGVNVLVNNAIKSAVGPLQDVDPDEVRDSIAVNVLGPIYGIRALHPLLREAARRGEPSYVLNIGSEHSLGVPPNVPAISAYTIAKYALLGVTDTARRDLADDGIGVTLVAPGWILTDQARSTIESADVNDQWYQSIMAGAAQEPDQVARSAFDGMLADRYIVVTNPASKGFALAHARDVIRAIEATDATGPS